MPGVLKILNITNTSQILHCHHQHHQMSLCFVLLVTSGLRSHMFHVSFLASINRDMTKLAELLCVNDDFIIINDVIKYHCVLYGKLHHFIVAICCLKLRQSFYEDDESGFDNLHGKHKGNLIQSCLCFLVLNLDFVVTIRDD